MQTPGWLEPGNLMKTLTLTAPLECLNAVCTFSWSHFMSSPVWATASCRQLSQQKGSESWSECTQTQPLHLQFVCLVAEVTDIFITLLEVQLLLSESGFCPVRQRRVSFRLYVTQSNSPVRYRPLASIHFTLFIPSSGKGLNPVATVARKQGSCLWKIQHLTYVFQSLSIQSTSSFSAAPNSCVTIKTTGSLYFTGEFPGEEIYLIFDLFLCTISGCLSSPHKVQQWHYF